MWWFRNVACGDSTGRNGTENGWFCMFPGLAWGKGEKGVVRFSVWRTSLGSLGYDGLVTSLVSLRMVSMVLVLWGV